MVHVYVHNWHGVFYYCLCKIHDICRDTYFELKLKGILYFLNWTHGMDSWIGLTDWTGNSLLTIIQMLPSSCNAEDTNIQNFLTLHHKKTFQPNSKTKLILYNRKYWRNENLTNSAWPIKIWWKARNHISKQWLLRHLYFDELNLMNVTNLSKFSFAKISCCMVFNATKFLHTAFLEFRNTSESLPMNLNSGATNIIIHERFTLIWDTGPYNF